MLDSLLSMMEKLVTSVESKGDCVDFLETGENEQKLVMQAILDACNSNNSEICLGGLVLLCNIATSCYELLEEYMDDIVPITIKAIGSQHKRVHVQGIEFWKAVSQIEDPRDSTGRKINKGHMTSSYLVKQNLDELIPALFDELIRGELVTNESTKTQDLNNELFTPGCSGVDEQGDPMDGNIKDKFSFSPSCVKKEEINANEDCWIAPREVIIYFSELCENYPDAIDCYVIPLVINEIQHLEWRHRYAALWSMLVFLKQMDPYHAESVLSPIFPLVREALRDMTSSKIRNTALWVISWMFEKCPSLITSRTSHELQQLTDDLIACLNDKEGRVSPSSCIALTAVAKASYLMASLKFEKNHRPPTFVLSPYYKMIATQLLKAANQRGRLTAAFVSLREVLVNAPDDCYSIILEITDELLESLRKTIENSARRRCHCYETLQNLLIGVLRRVVETLKSGEPTTIELCQKFMTYLLSFVTRFPAGLASEETLMALLTVVSRIGKTLERHIDKLVPYLMSTISSLPKGDPALPLAMELVNFILSRYSEFITNKNCLP